MQFKKDIFTVNRWNYSRRINLHCHKCDHIFATYQKDWPWNLRRLYFDRIMSPKTLTKLVEQNLESIPNLRCWNCNFEIWVPYIYEKENRPAFRIYQDAIKKSIRKLKD